MNKSTDLSFLLQRHLPIALLAFLLALPFWYGRMDWDAEMQLWRAVGDSSFLLLFFTLAIGPVSRLWPATARLVPWRRETGIWYGLTALLHTVLVWDGWARWDWLRLLGYEFVPELGRVARLEPGFGLANLMGLVAVFFTLVLVATSANWAVNRLGATAWKWLQYSSLYSLLSGRSPHALLSLHPLHGLVSPPRAGRRQLVSDSLFDSGRACSHFAGGCVSEGDTQPTNLSGQSTPFAVVCFYALARAGDV